MSNVVAELVGLIGFEVDRTSLSGVTAAINKVSKAVRAVAALNVAKDIGEGFYHLAEKTADSAKELLAQSAALGLSVEKVQEWGFVSKASGTSTQQFAIGVSMLESNLRRLSAGQGGKYLAQTFAKVGIDSSKATKILRSPDGVDGAIKQIADRVQKLGGTAESGAIVTALFGRRAGRGLAADLAGGSARVNALQAQAEKLGLLHKADVANLKDMGNSLDRVKYALGQVASQALGAAAPAIKKLADDFTTWLSDPDNQKFVQGAISGAFKLAAKAAEALGHAIEFLGNHRWVMTALIDSFVFLKGMQLTNWVVGLTARFWGLAAAEEAAATAGKGIGAGAAGAEAGALGGAAEGVAAGGIGGGVAAGAASAALPVAVAVGGVVAAVKGWQWAFGKQAASMRAIQDAMAPGAQVPAAVANAPDFPSWQRVKRLERENETPAPPTKPSEDDRPWWMPSGVAAPTKAGTPPPVIVPQSTVNVTINGFKDAAQIAPKVGEAVDTANRRAANALNKGR